MAEGAGIGTEVARHYDNLPEKGRASRADSRIFHMRCLTGASRLNLAICRSFNNWTKSMLINEYLDKIRKADGFSGRISVLDIGCGKGGDLTKWHKVAVESS
jgi:mRNA (guanine-N7-)-methyltransferase